MGRLLLRYICWNHSQIYLINIPFQTEFYLFVLRICFFPKGVYFYLLFIYIKMLGGLWQGMKFNLPWDETLTWRCFWPPGLQKRIFYLYGRLIKISFVAFISLMILAPPISYLNYCQDSNTWLQPLTILLDLSTLGFRFWGKKIFN